MNDFEATVICAKAFGLQLVDDCKKLDEEKKIIVVRVIGGLRYKYGPLKDGESAFDLLERFQLAVDRFPMMEKDIWGWRVKGVDVEHSDINLKRAITFCAAKQQA